MSDAISPSSLKVVSVKESSEKSHFGGSYPTLRITYSKNGETQKPLIMRGGDYNYGAEHIPEYMGKEVDAVGKYLKSVHSELDASAVTSAENGQTWYDDIMRQYPAPQDTDKPLAAYDQAQQESTDKQAYYSLLNRALEIAWFGNSEQDRQKLHLFTRDVLEHIAGGKRIEDFKIKNAGRYERGFGFAHSLRLYDAQKEIRASLGNLFEDRNKTWIPEGEVITAERAKEILEVLPTTPFETREELDDFSQSIVYGGEKDDLGLNKGKADINRSRNNSHRELGVVLLQQALHDAMSRKAKGAVKRQLQKLEKEKRIKQKAEERKRQKEEAKTINAADGKERQKRADARRHLVDRGLVLPKGERSGTDCHWGDAPQFKKPAPTRKTVTR